MRIALVITELDPGGAENCLTQLACFLADQGHSVRVYAIGPPPVDGQDVTLKSLTAHNVPFSFSISPGGKRSRRSFHKVVGWLRRELNAFQPHVVQSMLFHGNLVSALAIKSKQVKFFGGVRVRQPERWRWWVQRWAARRMQKIVCVSDDVAAHCIGNERIPAAKVTTIPNGIDVATAQKLIAASPVDPWKQFGLPASSRVLLFVGRLHPQKGVGELLERADELLMRLPEHHLVLVGNGPLETRLREQSANKQCAKRIHFAGWQPNAIALMARAELLLLPAAYEGMPNVILEAMAAGLAFVAFDVDGVRQLVGDTANHPEQVVAPDNYSDFVARTVELAQRTEWRAKCIAHNRDRIEQHFQLQQQLAKYAALYEI